MSNSLIIKRDGDRRLTTGYRGNENVKRAGTVIKWTPELIRELKRCKDDIIYFIENYCKIVTLDKGLVLFKLYDYQKELLRLYQNHKFVISMQSRQSGKCLCINTSTLVRNKRTGQIETLTLGELYEKAKEQSKMLSDSDRAF